MQAVFVELPPFARQRQDYLDDEQFQRLQQSLLAHPQAGAVIEGTGGLRKMRHTDARRGQGKRGGLRVIYYWWVSGHQFWLFTLYDKGEMDDLTTRQRKILHELLDRELAARKTPT